jgi:hypothetical protein
MFVMSCSFMYYPILCSVQYFIFCRSSGPSKFFIIFFHPKWVPVLDLYIFGSKISFVHLFSICFNLNKWFSHRLGFFYFFYFVVAVWRCWISRLRAVFVCFLSSWCNVCLLSPLVAVFVWFRLTHQLRSTTDSSNN